MQKWQKNRNYRKYENADGSFTYVIIVEGESVEVSEEIFKAYSQADRRERYCAERDIGRLISLDRMDEDDFLLNYLTDEHIESAEDSAIRLMLIDQVKAAFALLIPEEQRLIQAVVMDGATEQDYADAIGVSQVAVHKRKKRILKKLLDFMVIKV